MHSIPRLSDEATLRVDIQPRRDGGVGIVDNAGDVEFISLFLTVPLELHPGKGYRTILLTVVGLSILCQLAIVTPFFHLDPIEGSIKRKGLRLKQQRP